MISITCTQCRAVLDIDDAFAGGVCRCQHCGTIQTVPAHLKPTAAATPYGNPSTATAKALYKNQSAGHSGGGNVATTGSSPSGLDDLAQAVVSSGLSGSGLRSSSLNDGVSSGPIPKTPAAKLVNAVEPTSRQTRAKKPPIAIYIGGAAILIVGIVIIVLLTRGKGNNSSTTNSGTGGGNGGTVDGSSNGGGGTAATIKHSFCGVTLSGPTVVYVIDRGVSVRDSFDAIKVATCASISSLNSGSKFAVIFCQENPTYVAYPDKDLLPASHDAAEKLKAHIDSEQAGGASVLNGGLHRAIAYNPTSIVLITGKPSPLSDVDEQAVVGTKKAAGGKFTIYAFCVGVENPTLSANAGGTLQYKTISVEQLNGN